MEAYKLDDLRAGRRIAAKAKATPLPIPRIRMRRMRGMGEDFLACASWLQILFINQTSWLGSQSPDLGERQAENYQRDETPLRPFRPTLPEGE